MLPVRLFSLVLAVSALCWGFESSRAIGTPHSGSPTSSPQLIPHRISLANGKSFDLNVAEGFSIKVAAQGLKRVRFMAKSPDQRIFLTDMYNLADNKRGTVYILDGFDLATKSFAKVTPYLTGLRNPNSIAFYKDEQGVDWFYLALTDRLVRYKYIAGENTPTATPVTLATFPDYGLSYKYGGWHLTRTVAIGSNGKIYVSVGSSCNACEEKEEVRASILEMDADGKNQKRFAHGLRNAVGLRWIGNRGSDLQGGNLFATNMGSDHLGDHKPADTMYKVNAGDNFGWPYCFQSGAARLSDPKFNPGGKKLNCRNRPAAYAAFDAHSSPLGLEYFDGDNGEKLRDTFLVGLHGSTKKNLKRGYRVVQLPGSAGSDGSAAPEDFINGFLEAGKVHGRPVDILRVEPDAFLLTDDYAGVVYYVSRN
ncbi:MAG: PQQ-dependent sugar dehydrogenase [Pyrinomonadaceae bacterium]|nr:PQQ-dependent sugar dehydrogenase [Pyrinomonadaceae bacterium]